jgi:hypothetical protein
LIFKRALSLASEPYLVNEDTCFRRHVAMNAPEQDETRTSIRNQPSMTGSNATRCRRAHGPWWSSPRSSSSRGGGLRDRTRAPTAQTLPSESSTNQRPAQIAAASKCLEICRGRSVTGPVAEIQTRAGCVPHEGTSVFHSNPHLGGLGLIIRGRLQR